MKNVSIVVAIFGMNTKVLCRLGTFLSEYFNMNVALGRVKDGGLVDFLPNCG
jgi:hypothetical protein